jgi:hypothetical protein
VKIKSYISKWGGRVGFGFFVDFQEWSIWDHYFDIGFSFGPWDIGLTITLWTIQESMKPLLSQGMSDREAWIFCNQVRKGLPDPYHGNMKREIEKALSKKG